MRKAVHSILLITCALLLSACISSDSTKEAVMTSHRLVVEGRITVRGNEPFTAVILQTENQNHYILRMSAEMRRELLTPAYRRVTGRLYLDQWNGRDYAHLEVFLLEKVPQRTGALSQKTSEVSSSSE